MRVQFTKMHGAGNDFVVIDARDNPLDALMRPEAIRRLADRRFGIGADQVLFVAKPSVQEAQFDYRIFNADGLEVEQCGNGARCFARFVANKGLVSDRTFKVNTLAGLIEPMLNDDGSVTVDMGSAQFDPEALPLQVEGLKAEQHEGQWVYLFEPEHPGMGFKSFWAAPVSMGNPHLVQWVDDLQTASVETIGRWLNAHPRLPKGVNAGFASLDPQTNCLDLRVYERGAGETLACGTGACAAAVSALAQGRLAHQTPVQVVTPGGLLRIDWRTGNAEPDKDTVLLTGPAVTVFSGEIEL
ncbi:MAG: diaminopimelate epimerase [Proteobacteria bacterium]|nr:diaminopimelate epimerase [Pseudomonadota bacterium]